MNIFNGQNGCIIPSINYSTNPISPTNPISQTSNVKPYVIYTAENTYVYHNIYSVTFSGTGTISNPSGTCTFYDGYSQAYCPTNYFNISFNDFLNVSLTRV